MLNAFNNANFVPVGGIGATLNNYEVTGLTGTNTARVIQLVRGSTGKGTLVELAGSQSPAGFLWPVLAGAQMLSSHLHSRRGRQF